MRKQYGYLFAGQGAQSVGMGSSLYEEFDQAKRVYEDANEALGWDLKSISFEGPEEKLTQTGVCQPALYVHGIAILRVLQANGADRSIGAVAGLSLGELTALTAAESFSFADGLALVAERGRLMQMACEETDGGMASVIGGSADRVEELCRQCDIDVANYNCPGQIVISGDSTKVAEAIQLGKDMGFKLIKPLKVAGAYHSRLMEPAREAFAEKVASTKISSPKIPFFANVTGSQAADPAEIGRLLVEQVVSSVRFEGCLREMISACEIDGFVECGPGNILGGMVRRTDSTVPCEGVSTSDDIRKILST